jgi:hypothetical protein
MRTFIYCLSLFLSTSSLFGQVKGVSYTIAPSGSYNWFGNEAGLGDAFMFGGRLGFGFGEYVELRATYLQTIDQQTDFAGLDLGIDTSFANRDVDLRRYGAELKLNIGRGSLLPYLLLGGGIQDTERDALERAENIFGTAGIGLTLSAADRYTLGVEGKYITYSGNAVRNLFDEVERQENDLNLDDFNADQVGTFAVAANLQFYLGGRRPGQLSEIDEVYLRNFQGGISGLSVPMELGFARINWDDALPYRDAYFAGGTAGFSFGPLISLRGFYYRGMNDDELNFDFDDISLYGADVRFNLSQTSSGIMPYLSLGGGYIDLNDGYNRDADVVAELASSQGFASGGGGINLKFGERINLNGGVRAVLTSGADVEDISTTEQLTTSLMYNAGFGFVLGGRNQNNPDVVRQSTMEDRLRSQQDEFDRRADSIRVENQLELAELEARYRDTLAMLDRELIDAIEAGDTAVAADIAEERAETRAIIDEVSTRQTELTNQAVQEDLRRTQMRQAELDAAMGRTPQPVSPLNATPTPGDGSVIILQSAQIDKLIDAIGNRTATPPAPAAAAPGSAELQEILRRLDRLEDRMLLMNGYAPRPLDRDTDRTAEERMRQLERQIESLRAPGGTSDPDDDRFGEAANQREADMQRRIEELERQLRDPGVDDRRDITRYDDDDDRLQSLEQRLMERMERLQDTDNDEELEELRSNMVRDLTDYQRDLQDEIDDLRDDLARANREVAQLEAREAENNERLDLEREALRQARREARREARQESVTYTDSLGNTVTAPGTVGLEDISVNTGGVYLADENADGFFSNITYTGMSGTAGFNFGDATGLGLGLRWHYKLGPDQRAEFMPEAYFGIGAPTTFGIFGNLIYPIIGNRSEENGLIPYAGLGVGAMQIKDDEDSDELNFRPAINIIFGTYLPVGNGRVFVDFSTRNFFSVNQLTGGYRFNF